jgi:dihydrofolate synthase/folylpolyglutamate synthase
VLGETDPDLAAIFRAEQPTAVVHEREIDFECIENQLALGGRLVDIRTPRAMYTELFLPLHGRHQGDNAACAVVALEDFFDAPLDQEVVQEGFNAVRWPGRFEVLGHQPLVIIDGAHNPPGADACAQVMDEDFDPAGKRILVVGFLKGRNPADMLSALRADTADLVVCCTPDSPRALPASEIAVAARAMGCDEVVVVPDVAKACDLALSRAGGDDAVLVTGSLYVVGEARPHLILRSP